MSAALKGLLARGGDRIQEHCLKQNQGLPTANRPLRSFPSRRRRGRRHVRTARATYSDSVAETGAGLRAGSAYVVAHTGVLAGCAVEVCDWARTVRAWESSGPGRVGACRGSGCAKIRLSTVAIQDWCAENKAGYEAGSRACTVITKPNTHERNSLGPTCNT